MSGAGTSTSDTSKTQQQAEQGTTASNTTGTQAQAQNTSSQTGPWSATQPLLSSIIGSLNGLSGGTSPTPAQSEAAANLQTSAGGIPNEGAAATSALNPILNGQYGGAIGGALTGYEGTLSPYLSSSYLNPMSTPGLGTQLQALNTGITNQVNDQFAAAGRDLSPANTQALATGLAQGEAPVITGQYNQNVAAQQGAANSLYAAGTMTPEAQAQLATSGINTAGAIPGLYTAPATSQLGAANTSYALPYSNLGMLEGLTNPIAGLGQTSSGTTTGTGTTSSGTTGNYSGTGTGSSTSDTSNTASLLQDFSSLFGGSNGGAMGNFMSFLSDARAKDNIAPVGMLFDGTPIASFNYKGDPRSQIGVIAQDVEKRTPDAVSERGGLKHVDYGKATARARAIGMLSDMPGFAQAA
jgi:endosialidase-like protein